MGSPSRSIQSTILDPEAGRIPDHPGRAAVARHRHAGRLVGDERGDRDEPGSLRVRPDAHDGLAAEARHGLPAVAVVERPEQDRAAARVPGPRLERVGGERPDRLVRDLVDHELDAAGVAHAGLGEDDLVDARRVQRLAERVAARVERRRQRVDRRVEPLVDPSLDLAAVLLAMDDDLGPDVDRLVADPVDLRASCPSDRRASSTERTQSRTSWVRMRRQLLGGDHRRVVPSGRFGHEEQLDRARRRVAPQLGLGDGLRARDRTRGPLRCRAGSHGR